MMYKTDESDKLWRILSSVTHRVDIVREKSDKTHR